MIIHCLPVWGSPRGVIPQDITGSGVGGSELWAMNLFRKFVEMGHTVRFYNSPKIEGNFYGVDYLHNDKFNPAEERDILITFRGPDERSKYAKKKKHIGISSDQYTVGNYVDWYKEVDEFIGISEFHKKDHIARYGNIAEKMKVIDIGVDEKEYCEKLEKIPYQVIYCSVPDRGLDLLNIYWDELKTKIPQLKLFITGSHGLWNGGFDNDMEWRMKWIGKADVTYKGRIPRDVLVKLQLLSEAQLYPVIYDENFCSSTAESQIAGCYTITSNQGALETTNFTGVKINDIHSNPLFREMFIQKTVDYFNLSIEQRKDMQKDIQWKAKRRFSWDNVMKEWEKVLNVQ